LIVNIHQNSREIYPYSGSSIGFGLQNFPIVIGTIFFTNQGTHRPIAARDKAGLVFPL